jgi:hypothetical protein
MEGLEEAGPEAGLAPQAVAAIDRVPGAELRRELMPGSIGTEHPEDAGQDGAGGTADATGGCSGSKEWLHAGPLRLRQVRPVRHGGSGARRCDGWSGAARYRACPRSSQDVATPGDRLVSTPPPRPAQMEAALLDWVVPHPEQAAHFRYREGNQVACAAPFFPPCWVAARRVTSR